jgi:hypothetical protein
MAALTALVLSLRPLRFGASLRLGRPLASRVQVFAADASSIISRQPSSSRSCGCGMMLQPRGPSAGVKGAIGLASAGVPTGRSAKASQIRVGAACLRTSALPVWRSDLSRTDATAWAEPPRQNRWGLVRGTVAFGSAGGHGRGGVCERAHDPNERLAATLAQVRWVCSNLSRCSCSRRRDGCWERGTT